MTSLLFSGSSALASSQAQFDQDIIAQDPIEAVATHMPGSNNGATFVASDATQRYIVITQSSPGGGEAARSPRSEASVADHIAYDFESLLGSIGSYEACVRGHSAAIRAYFVDIDPRLVPEVRSMPGVEAVYPDIEVHALDDASNAAINADDVWALTDKSGRNLIGTGITIAIIDTGVDYTHPDLGGGFGPGFKVVGGYDFVNDDSDPMDDHGHGTHVAGIIAADGALTGVAPGATLYAYKALDASGSGFMSDVIEAIEAASDPNGDGDTSDHVDIISMSLGGDGSADDPVCAAVDYATSLGILVVVAAGNSGSGYQTISSPGLAESALTVGAADNTGRVASFSSRGPGDGLSAKPDVMAPGVSILSTVPVSGTSISDPTGYKSLSGTSMATPHVSGAAALILQLYPTWSPDQVKAALMNAASDKGYNMFVQGSGFLDVLASATEGMIATQPSYAVGICSSGASLALRVTNIAPASVQVTVSVESSLVLYSNFTSPSAPVQANYLSASPTSFSVPAEGSSSIALTIAIPSDAAEGYYEGVVTASSSHSSIRVPVSFVLLSLLQISVLDLTGTELSDPYGSVYVYRIPGGDSLIAVHGDGSPVPPAALYVPSGTYNVHASGGMILYWGETPYLLSGTVVVPKGSSASIVLDMRQATERTINAVSPEGMPLYLATFAWRAMYDGSEDVEFFRAVHDYSVYGLEYFSVPAQFPFFMSDAQIALNLSFTAYAFSPVMGEFMELNGESITDRSRAGTDFSLRAFADRMYLVELPYPRIDQSSVPMAIQPVTSELVETSIKFDAAGVIDSPWTQGGTSRLPGGLTVFYMPIDAKATIDPFPTGAVKSVFVSGPFALRYWPGSTEDTMHQAQFYEPDWTLLEPTIDSSVMVPDTSGLVAMPARGGYLSFGAGPFIPSSDFAISPSMLELRYPIFLDASGNGVSESSPTYELRKDGVLISSDTLSEHWWLPSPVRYIQLSGAGTYTLTLDLESSSDVSAHTTAVSTFAVGADDYMPPRIESLSMPQKFSAGANVPLTLAVSDDGTIASVSAEWSSDGGLTWVPLALSNDRPGIYSASFVPSPAVQAVSLRFTILDSADNSLVLTSEAACARATPVDMEISVDRTELPYRSTPIDITVSGHLLSLSGEPLSSTSSSQIAIKHDGQVIGFLMDHSFVDGQLVCDGSIEFTWSVIPSSIASGPNDTVSIDFEFDLGTYEVARETVVFTTIPSTGVPPEIVLDSPMNDSLISGGATISLSITDDTDFTAQYRVDGGLWNILAEPYDISASQLPEGTVSVDVRATDSDGLVSVLSLVFEVDKTAPTIDLTDPEDGSVIAPGAVIDVDVADPHIHAIEYLVNGQSMGFLAPPYSLSTDGWNEGENTLTIEAVDSVGNSARDSWSFIIDGTAPVIELVQPVNNTEVPSGYAIQLSVYDLTEVTVLAFVDGSTQLELTYPFTIPTSEWSPGTHSIAVFASDVLGHTSSAYFTVGILEPSFIEVLLVAPNDGARICPGTVVSLSVESRYEVRLFAAWDGNSLREVSGPPEFSTGSLEDGTHILHVTAIDFYGTVVERDFCFVVDSTPPSILGLTAVGVDDTLVNVSVELEPGIEDLDAVYLYVAMGDSDDFASLPMVRDNLSESYYCLLVLDPGQRSLRMYAVASDLLGNSRTTEVLIFELAHDTDAVDDGAESLYGYIAVIGAVLVFSAMVLMIARTRKLKEKPATYSDSEMSQPCQDGTAIDELVSAADELTLTTLKKSAHSFAKNDAKEG